MVSREYDSISINDIEGKLRVKTVYYQDHDPCCLRSVRRKKYYRCLSDINKKAQKYCDNQN